MIYIHVLFLWKYCFNGNQNEVERSISRVIEFIDIIRPHNNTILWMFKLILEPF